MKLLECCLLFFLLSSFTVSALGTDEYRPYLHAAIVPEHPPLNLYGKYQTNLFQGSSTFTYPFTVPPGTNGLAPDVKISYNSHQARQRPDVLGSGWALSRSYIFRDVNSTISDASEDRKSTRLNSSHSQIS